MSQELISSVDWFKSSGPGTLEKTINGLVISGGTGATWIYTTDYIPLPRATGMIYEYDFDVSVTANDQVYIQIERFNADKGTISNSAATNCIGGYKPTADVSHVRYKGTIALATFGDPAQDTAFIRVRACNGYNNTTGTFIVHSWSLKAINNNRQGISVQKNGILIADSFRENYGVASFNKSGLVEGQHLYEY